MTTTTLHDPDAVNPDAEDVTRFDFVTVDASVTPSLPAANPNATVLAIAGRAAAIITGRDHVADQASAVYTPIP